MNLDVHELFTELYQFVSKAFSEKINNKSLQDQARYNEQKQDHIGYNIRYGEHAVEALAAGREQRIDFHAINYQAWFG